MSGLIRDLTFSARLLAREKGFTVTVVLVLAVCIGLNATIFSVVDSVILRPLPIPESERVLFLYNSFPGAGVERAATSVPDYLDRRQQIEVLEEQAIYRLRGLNLGTEGRPERVRGMAVTPSLFRLLQVPPEEGRVLTDADAELGQEQKVVLSHALWHRQYGGDPAAVGRDLRIDGARHRIVGVMPEDFLFLDPEIRLWTPLAFTDEQRSEGARFDNNWRMIGRLAPGATLEQARQQIDALNARNLERFPQYRDFLAESGFHTRVVWLQDDLVRDVEGTLYFLWGGVALVLLIGCVNLTHLMMVRANARRRELALRLALGAGRRHVIRQLLSESVLLSAIGGALGLLLGYGGLAALRALGLEQLPRSAEIAIAEVAVLYTFTLALAVGVVLSILPVARLLSTHPEVVLRQEGRASTSGGGSRAVRRALVVAQVAVAFVLLAGACLLLTSFRRILAVDPGFEPAGILTASVNLPSARYRADGELAAFTARALEQIRAQPGVVSAGVTSCLPLGGSFRKDVLVAEGHVAEPGESMVAPNLVAASPGYFRTLGLPLVEGRLFDDRDAGGSAPAVIVDQRLARRFWPDAEALGKRVFMPEGPDDVLDPEDEDRLMTVVGVVADSHLSSLVRGEEVGTFYLPFAQAPRRVLSFAVKTAVEPGSLAIVVRSQIADIDPEVPLYDAKTMDERMADSLIERRSSILLALVFAAVALLLSALGIYGLLAYLVARRSKEIGIRIALGASTGGIFRLVLSEGLRVAGAGLALGLGGAFALRRTIASQLYGIQPLDPIVLVLTIGILTLVSFAACALPAARATRVDPVAALNRE